MTPAQSDAMCKALGKILAWDDRFFKQRPDRLHRIRRAYPAEIQFHQWRGFLTSTLPNSLRVFVGKRATGLTRSAVGFLLADAETDLSEEDAARVFAILGGHDTLAPITPIAHSDRALSSSHRPEADHA